uniref:Uncharacterized protein MANES_02G190000 n=1 Tax=Rhizophora mucronata TaxID=61149 RepID=A0A2P2LCB5_RHIMU
MNKCLSKFEASNQEGRNTMVWTIPIRCVLNMVIVLGRSKADMSPISILWMVS